MCVCVLVAQSCLTLCDLMDCSPPGSSVHGFLWAGILEWVAISFSRSSSLPRGGTYVSCISFIGRWILYYWRHLGSPKSKCPLTDEGINIKCYIHTMEYCLAIKGTKCLLIQATTWMHLVRHYTESKKPVTKDHILYDSIYLKCPE